MAAHGTRAAAPIFHPTRRPRTGPSGYYGGMPKVRAKPGEQAGMLMKRFKKACDNEKLRDQMKRAATYEKPSDMRRRKKNQQARRASK